MPLPSDLPIVDHHCHLSPHGDSVVAAERFRAAGGTHLFLSTQNYETTVPSELTAYERQFETTEALARRVTEATGVVVYVVVAPYPIDLVRLAPHAGVSVAAALHRTALDLAAKWVRERRAVALGEVGRPHFAVDDAALRAAGEELFDYALVLAKESDCPAIVHCEDLGPQALSQLTERARRAGLAPSRLVKHYARQRLSAGGPSTASKSYLARRELFTEVLGDPGPWFLETDYLDDPGRPGAVLDLATVPRRAAWLAAQHPESVERLRVPFEESIHAVYGWRPEVRT
ncbi:MAG: TatD family hydrolase [Thermoplasmata archaeon]